MSASPIGQSKSVTGGRETADNSNNSMAERAQTGHHDKGADLILVLINRHSGRGRSVSIYEREISPFLKSHNIEHEVFISQDDRRVSSLLGDMRLSVLLDLRSILVVSGDGLFHEVVNALMSREDWQQAMAVPIGIVPTGSGNGLAYTLIRQKHPEVTDPRTAIKICCELATLGETCQADLVKITINPGGARPRTIWSFLSLGWGLLADIDIDSEWLRCLGEFRFTIYGLLRAVTSVSYRGRLSYRIAKTESNTETKEPQPLQEGRANGSGETGGQHGGPNSSRDDDAAWVHLEDKFACLYAVYQSHVSRATKFAPKSTLTDQLIYLTFIRGKINPRQAVEFMLAIKDGSHEKLNYCTIVPVEYFEFQPLERSKIVVDGELIPWNLSDGSIKAQVVPRVLKLLTKPNDE